MFDRYTLIEHSPYMYKSIYSNRTVDMDCMDKREYRIAQFIDGGKY